VIVLDVLLRKLIIGLLHSKLDQLQDFFVLLVVSYLQVFLGDFKNQVFVLIKTGVDSEVELGPLLFLDFLYDALERAQVLGLGLVVFAPELVELLVDFELL
jgi:hypothetical protein